MAAGGSLATAGLLWLCLAPAALLRLHQPQPLLVVEPGEMVEIICEADEVLESKSYVSWYRRGEDGPHLVMGCGGGTNGRFSCKSGGHKVTLSISSAHPSDTGLYLCAFYGISHLKFGNGTALLVGDSWRNQSWVRVLAPRGDPHSLVCAVGSTAGPVLISWSGGARPVLGLGGDVGPLITPLGQSGGAGGPCEVRFNASGPPVRRSTELHVGSCMTPIFWVLAVVGVLLLLILFLTIRRLLRPTPVGDQPGTLMPPASREEEGQLTYAQLTFLPPTSARTVTHSPTR